MTSVQPNTPQIPSRPSGTRGTLIALGSVVSLVAGALLLGYSVKPSLIVHPTLFHLVHAGELVGIFAGVGLSLTSFIDSCKSPQPKKTWTTAELVEDFQKEGPEKEAVIEELKHMNDERLNTLLQELKSIDSAQRKPLLEHLSQNPERLLRVILQDTTLDEDFLFELLFINESKELLTFLEKKEDPLTSEEQRLLRIAYFQRAQPLFNEIFAAKEDTKIPKLLRSCSPEPLGKALREHKDDLDLDYLAEIFEQAKQTDIKYWGALRKAIGTNNNDDSIFKRAYEKVGYVLSPKEYLESLQADDPWFQNTFNEKDRDLIPTMLAFCNPKVLVEALKKAEETLDPDYLEAIFNCAMTDPTADSAYQAFYSLFIENDESPNTIFKKAHKANEIPRILAKKDKEMIPILFSKYQKEDLVQELKNAEKTLDPDYLEAIFIHEIRNCKSNVPSDTLHFFLIQNDGRVHTKFKTAYGKASLAPWD